jgi:predicted enzyme related to lactoylglutathione lyase
VLRAVDCITVPVPDLDTGLAFYRDALGQRPLWRNDHVGQAAVALPDGDTELVLTTRSAYAPGWLVTSAERAAETIRRAGGRIITDACDIPVGRLAVAADPFGNDLVLLDLSKGRH